MYDLTDLKPDEIKFLTALYAVRDFMQANQFDCAEVERAIYLVSVSEIERTTGETTLVDDYLKSISLGLFREAVKKDELYLGRIV